MRFREFIATLDAKGELAHVRKPVSKNLEIASIINSIKERPVLFHSVKESKFAVVAGLCSSRELVARALRTDKEGLLHRLAAAAREPKKPAEVKSAPCQEVVEKEPDLGTLPILKHFAEDAGPYITSAVAVIKDPETGRNACFHRLLQLGRNEFAARIVEGRQTHTTYNKLLKQGKELEIAFCIGNSTAVMLAASMGPPPGVDELSIANALDEFEVVRCKTKDIEVPADSEFVLEGRVTDRSVDEGPFVDITGTMDIVRKQPVIEIDCITHRKDAIFQALLPGKLEHRLVMGMPKEPDIYNEVSKVARCLNVVLTPGGCCWLHAVVQIRKEKPDDGRLAAEAAFRAHGSLKHCVVVDEDIDPTDPVQVEWAIATRFQGDKDMVLLSRQPASSLDPSSEKPPGQKSVSAKLAIDATIPFDRPRQKFMKVAYEQARAEDWLE